MQVPQTSHMTPGVSYLTRTNTTGNTTLGAHHITCVRAHVFLAASSSASHVTTRRERVYTQQERQMSGLHRGVMGDEENEWPMMLDLSAGKPDQKGIVVKAAS